MEERIQKVLGTSVPVRPPPTVEMGDYAVFVGKDSGTAVEKVRAELGADAANVEAVNGFVNITLSPERVREVIAQADREGEAWGRGSVREGARMMIEYTDPNPFKEMHIGHLMGNVIGEALARLVAHEGASVARANYQGDVGPHVAKALWALRERGVTEPATASEIGEAYAEGSRAYEEDKKARAEIDEINVAVYTHSDPALMELWRKGRDVSLAAFEHLYRILGTKFDFYFFESETSESGLRLVKDGLAKGIFEESEGAIIYKGEKVGLHTLVFITSRDTPTYEAKDIGLAFLKEERYPCDESIIISAAEQIGHFKVMLAALTELAPLLGAKTKHVAHGLLRLTSGKMSSREGNVITALELIQDIIERASEKNKDPLIAEQVAIGAIKYMILRQSPGSDIVFDPEKSLSLEGDSGPYLQYALVRAAKILSYSSEDAGGAEVPQSPYAIERLILHYPEVAARAARELSPNLLVAYLTELAAAWNSFYASEQVLGSPREAYNMRVARAFANTMANGLATLGIPAPEKM
jgi:arginyl-tRNA synthetase